MTPLEVTNRIESLNFAINVGLANSFRAFLRNIDGDPVVKELLESAKSPDVARQILKRVLSLSKMGVDFRYLHRFDIPLAIYLWVLSRTHPELATAAAEATAYLTRTWWTEQVSRYILEGLFARSNAATTVLTGYSSATASYATTTNPVTVTTTFLPDPLFGGTPTGQGVNVTTSTADKKSVMASNVGAPIADVAQAVLGPAER